MACLRSWCSKAEDIRSISGEEILKRLASSRYLTTAFPTSST